jgi:hypothetical protein
MSHQLLESAIDAVERDVAVDLGRIPAMDDDKDDTYYPQFSEAVRREAAAMAEHYEIFYCLEKSIREVVTEQLEEEFGGEWWTTSVPEAVRANVAANIQRERDSGVTPRSDASIDYTTFGELGEIIRNNWTVFASTFNNRKALDRVLGNLNTLRGPIAHCSPLAPDEVVRLRLAVTDWYRLME